SDFHLSCAVVRSDRCIWNCIPTVCLTAEPSPCSRIFRSKSDCTLAQCGNPCGSLSFVSDKSLKASITLEAFVDTLVGRGAEFGPKGSTGLVYSGAPSLSLDLNRNNITRITKVDFSGLKNLRIL
ncbi:hypothetical protein XENOCAPTIV_022267, partial [Xenoophorus captivus]